MTSKAETKRIIDRAWWAIERALGGGEAARMFILAYSHAKDSEAEHRRAGAAFTRGQARYRLSVDYAARYFACKWFLDWEQRAPRTWMDAAGIRLDALYAWGARDAFRNYDTRGCVTEASHADAYNELVTKHSDLLSVDYATDIAERT